VDRPNQLAVEPCLLQHMVPVVPKPVGRDDLLGLLERERPRADFLVERVFDRIFRLGPDEVAAPDEDPIMAPRTPRMMMPPPTAIQNPI